MLAGRFEREEEVEARGGEAQGCRVEKPATHEWHKETKSFVGLEKEGKEAEVVRRSAGCGYLASQSRKDVPASRGVCLGSDTSDGRNEVGCCELRAAALLGAGAVGRGR